MRELKDTSAATVRIGYDGRVHKHYRGTLARERFENERRVLRYLEKKNCLFVPRILEEDSDHLYLVTTNCGAKVNTISDEKLTALFKELEDYGVIHADQAARNVTYSGHIGRFCLIDFEFASIPELGVGLTLEEVEKVQGPGRNRQRQTPTEGNP